MIYYGLVLWECKQKSQNNSNIPPLWKILLAAFVPGTPISLFSRKHHAIQQSVSVNENPPYLEVVENSFAKNSFEFYSLLGNC